jgi:DNA polymerase/3'-5' exonuclease PolX
MSLKQDLHYDTALEIARDFATRTKDLYKRCEIAGSVRRKEPIVHDIDFAVIPSMKDRSKWKEKVIQRVKEIGGSVISLGELIVDILYRNVQVNLFLGIEDIWGVTLMWATGPKGHTIGMTIKARDKGLVYSSKGIWTRDEPPKLIPARTEEEVAKILDWTYKPPETRGKNAKDKTPF